MIVTDNSGQVAFRGENYVGKPVDGWSRLGYPHGDSLSLRQIPFDRMRAIAGGRC
ncbi:MAG: hypothetical protein JJE27_04220 [Thermoleophilia bacterium]|nr:hypothetical protein [Thermoleophilia bacterium]